MSWKISSQVSEYKVASFLEKYWLLTLVITVSHREDAHLCWLAIFSSHYRGALMRIRTYDASYYRSETMRYRFYRMWDRTRSLRRTQVSARYPYTSRPSWCRIMPQNIFSIFRRSHCINPSAWKYAERLSAKNSQSYTRCSDAKWTLHPISVLRDQ